MRIRLGSRAVTSACRLGGALTFVVLPGLLLASFLAMAADHHTLAYDFHFASWQAGRHVLDGTTPFVAPDAITASGPGAATGSAPTWFVYPAPAALLFAPFALLPLAVGEVLFTLLCFAAVWGVLAVLGVRDWRFYGLVFLWPGVLAGIQTTNVSLLLVLAVALVWRTRDRPLPSGLTLGLAVALKLFVWPVGLWLLATRRYLAFGYAIAAGVIVNLIAWAIVGFDQIPRYRDLLRALTRFEHGRTSSWPDVLIRAGASDATARALPLLIAVLACVGCIATGRRGDDRASISLALFATLAATPILWSHYYAFLLIPLVLLLPRVRSLVRPVAATHAPVVENEAPARA